MTASEYYEGWTYQGGAFQLGFVLYWTLSALAPADILNACPTASSAEATRPMLEELLAEPWVSLSPAAARRSRRDRGGDALLPRVARPRHQRRVVALDGAERAVREVAVPALHMGGWYDMFAAGTIENFAGCGPRPPPRRRVRASDC